MADDTTDYVRVKSPAGAISIVPAEIVDALKESGYRVARRAAASDTDTGTHPTQQ